MCIYSSGVLQLGIALFQLGIALFPRAELGILIWDENLTSFVYVSDLHSDKISMIEIFTVVDNNACLAEESICLHYLLV